MKIQMYAALLAMALPVAVSAQQDDKNLVKNPGFENVTGKLKKPKSIAQAKDWTSPTGEPADLFSTTTKEMLAAAPQNDKGNEKPLAGNNYAGLTFYSFGDKSPRTYITTELLGPLKEGQKYCVSFNVSMADNNKYAVNNIAAHLHKKEMAIEEKQNLILDKEVLIKNSKNKVLSQSFGWETVCGIYTAKGGEKFLTIGNFNGTRETKFEKVAKPKGFTGTQLPIAYYYVDEVKVFLLDSVQECACEVEKVEKAEVIYDEVTGSNKEFTPEEKIGQNKIFFDDMSASLNATALEHLNTVLTQLNEHPEFKIEVIGHTDVDEASKIEVDDRAKDLAKRRANAVIDFLVKGGIAKERLVAKAQDDKTAEESEVAHAKHRRVEFVVVK